MECTRWVCGSFQNQRKVEVDQIGQRRQSSDKLSPWEQAAEDMPLASMALTTPRLVSAPLDTYTLCFSFASCPSRLYSLWTQPEESLNDLSLASPPQDIKSQVAAFDWLCLGLILVHAPKEITAHFSSKVKPAFLLFSQGSSQIQMRRALGNPHYKYLLYVHFHLVNLDSSLENNIFIINVIIK